VDARERLRLALRDALRARDTIAVSALRSALSAIGNAEAVQAGRPVPAGADNPHVAGAVSGLGAGEVARRALSAADIDRILRAEIRERQAAAREYERSGHADRAGQLRREADALMPVVTNED
jgi:uncharacterized protein